MPLSRIWGRKSFAICRMLLTAIWNVLSKDKS